MVQLSLFSPSAQAASSDADGLFLAWLSSLRAWLTKLPRRVAVSAFEARPFFEAGRSPRDAAVALALKARFTTAETLRYFGAETHGGY